MRKSVDSLPAYEEFMARYTQALWRYAFHLTGSQEAAQAVLTASFKELFQRRRINWLASEVSLWLYRLATQLAFQHPQAAKEPAAPAKAKAKAEHLDFSQRQQRLRRGLAGLEKKRRAILALTLLEGMPFFKAAAILDTEPQEFRREASLAYQQLKAALGEGFF